MEPHYAIDRVRVSGLSDLSVATVRQSRPGPRSVCRGTLTFQVCLAGRRERGE